MKYKVIHIDPDPPQAEKQLNWLAEQGYRVIAMWENRVVLELVLEKEKPRG